MNIINLIKNNKIYIFVLIILILIFTIFFIDINTNDFDESIIKNKKEDSYVLSLRWETIIIQNNKIKRIKEQQKELIYVWDRIKTLDNSIAIIFWADKSVTRLWEKTSINITNLNISNDISSIKIKFDISEWKSWSNVIRYLTNESYFIETCNNLNIAATVRWTVFEFNLDKQYINSIDHSVKIDNTSEKESINLSEWDAIMVSDLNKKINLEVIDKIWNSWNNEEDNNYIKKIIEENKKYFIDQFNKRKKSIKYKIYDFIWLNKPNINDVIKNIIINNDINSLENLDKFIWNIKKEEELKKVNKTLLDLYQQINFSPNTEENIIIKSKIRNSIINTASKENLDMYIKDFSKLNLFDYMYATKSWLEKSKKELGQKLNQYIKIAWEKNIKDEILSNFDKNTIKQIQSSFETINIQANLIVDTVKNESYLNKFILLMKNTFLSLIK